MMQQRTTRQTGDVQALVTRSGLSSFTTLDYEFDLGGGSGDVVEPYARTYPEHNWGAPGPQIEAEPQWLTTVDVRPERESDNRGGRE